MFNTRLSILLTACILATTLASAEPIDLNVMSFNIRYGTADDGDNSWPKRRDTVCNTITLELLLALVFGNCFLNFLFNYVRKLLLQIPTKFFLIMDIITTIIIIIIIMVIIVPVGPWSRLPWP